MCVFFVVVYLFFWGGGGRKSTSCIVTHVKIFTVGICCETIGSTFHFVVFRNFQLITAKRTFAFFPSQKAVCSKTFPFVKGIVAHPNPASIVLCDAILCALWRIKLLL